MQSARLIPLAPGSPLTHSMPPGDLIKQLVAQILLIRDPRKYRPYVEQLRDGAGTARFRRLIDAFLARAPSTPHMRRSLSIAAGSIASIRWCASSPTTA